jgi:hypothetical protein
MSPPLRKPGIRRLLPVVTAVAVAGVSWALAGDPPPRSQVPAAKKVSPSPDGATKPLGETAKKDAPKQKAGARAGSKSSAAATKKGTTKAAPPPDGLPPQPFLGYVFPPGGRRGSTLETRATGTDLQGATAVRVTGTGVTARVAEVVSPTSARLEVTIAPDAAPGEREIRLLTPGGVSNRFRFIVGELPEVKETEPNSDAPHAQPLPALPVLVNGQIGAPADRDDYRLSAKAGQTLVASIQARTIIPFIADAVPGWLDACLTLYDAHGKPLATVDDVHLKPDPVLVVTIPRDGEYVLEVKDILYRGRGDFVYRLSVGQLPYLSTIAPLGARRGTTARLALQGANLPVDHLDIAIPADSPAVRPVQVAADGLTSNPLPLAVDDLPEVAESASNDRPAQALEVTPPVIVNGRIERPGDVDHVAISVQAGQVLVLEVLARRLDSPLDAALAVLNARGVELVENDDAIDTGSPLMTHHADPRLVYTFPSSGDYTVRVRDIQGKGGDDFAYRLVIAPPRPDFGLRLSPDNPRVGQGDSAVITVEALRKDGFSGAIDLQVQDLPAGFIASAAVIPKNQDQARLTITAPPDAPRNLFVPTVLGTATVGGKPVTRKASAAEVVMQAFSLKHTIPTQEFLLTVVQQPAFRITVDRPPGAVLEIAQGGEAELKVKIHRKAGVRSGISVAALPPPPPGLSVRAVFVNPDQDEARLTVSATRFAPVGVLQNLIINGSIRTTGRQGINAVAPAIPVKIVPTAAPAAAAAFIPGPSRPGLTPERRSLPAVARRTPTKPARGGVGNFQQTVLLDVLAPYAGGRP